MAKLKITKRSVVREADYISFDAELAGFGVRVMPRGKPGTLRLLFFDPVK